MPSLIKNKISMIKYVFLVKNMRITTSFAQFVF